MKPQPLVEQLNNERYKEILVQKESLVMNLDKESYKTALLESLTKQVNYLEQGKIIPLSITWKNEEYIFLQVIGEKFSSNEEKKQFLKEVSFLKKVDLLVHNKEVLNLEDFLSGIEYSEDKVLPLVQIFTL